MAYTPSYTKPYADGFKNKPNETTPITADVMNGYDNAIVSIETYLAEGGGGGGSASIEYGDADDFATWSETADNGEVFVRTDDNDSASGGGYSTSETLIGTWIDGKPLYRRVITDIDLSVNSTTIDILAVSQYNVKNYIFRTYYLTNNNAGVVGNCNFEGSTTYYRVYVSSDNYIRFSRSNASYWNTMKAYLIVEYTKVGD